VTLGKTVCAHGLVATDIGPAVVNGEPDETVRVMLADNGAQFRLIERVVRELPEVTRRDSFDWRPGDRDGL